MARSKRLYFRSITRRWKSDIQKAEGRIAFFSPYLTSKTAERVIGSAKSPQNVEIYTVFLAENFVSCSSSLATARRLVRLGCVLYHLPHLHAKLLLIPGNVATIGSQNLTAGGEAHKEASVAFREPRTLDYIGEQIARWVAERQFITLQMIEDMEREIAPLLGQFRRLRRTCRMADQNIERLRTERQDREEREQAEREAREREEQERRKREAQQREECKRREKAEREERERRDRVRQILQKLPVAAKSIRTEVRRISNKYSLVPTEIEERLTHWICDGERVLLEKKNRYVCILEETGNFGWARVFPTRISFIGTEVTFTQPIRLDESLYKLKMSAIWNSEQAPPKNLVITLSNSRGDWLIKIGAWFTLTELEIVERTRNEDIDNMLLYNWIAGDGEQVFRTEMLSRALSPFTYSKKLYGVRPNDFIADVERFYNVRLAKVGKFNVLAIRKCRPFG